MYFGPQKNPSLSTKWAGGFVGCQLWMGYGGAIWINLVGIQFILPGRMSLIIQIIMSALTWLSVARIYICNGFDYHLIHKYNWVTLDFNSKFNLENTCLLVKKTGTMFSAFAPSVWQVVYFLNTCRIWIIFILIFQIICCGKYSLKACDLKVFFPL